MFQPHNSKYSAKSEHCLNDWEWNEANYQENYRDWRMNGEALVPGNASSDQSALPRRCQISRLRQHRQHHLHGLYLWMWWAAQSHRLLPCSTTHHCGASTMARDIARLDCRKHPRRKDSSGKPRWLARRLDNLATRFEMEWENRASLALFSIFLSFSLHKY